MAPTPTDSNLLTKPSSTTKPDGNYWNPANIAITVVASVLFLGFALAGIAFIVHKHRQRRKTAQSIPAKESLLDGDERKSNMFSRERASSVTVYVDQADRDTAYKGVDVDPAPAPLAPLHVNTQTPVSSASAGSGVSAASRNSNSTLGTMMLSPASENTRASRPRSTSTSSVRYYAVTPIDTTIPVPTIVRTMSD